MFERSEDRKRSFIMNINLVLKIALFVIFWLVGARAIPQCVAPDGIKVDEITSTTAKISWNPVSSADQYKVNIEDANDNPLSFNVEKKVSSTDFVVTGMNANSHYKVKLRSFCSEDHSDWSERVFFSTGSTEGSGSTGGGSCEIPTGLGVALNGTKATLSWSAAEGASQYEVQIEDGHNTPAFNQQFTTTATAQDVSGLSAEGEYKFKVKSLCGGNSSDHSVLHFFTVDGGGEGSGSTGGGSCEIPTGLGVALNGTKATLSWSAVEGANQYEVQIEDGDNTPAFNQQFTTTATTQDVSGLSAGGEYKFKVKSLCGGNSSDHSVLHFFTVDGNAGGGGNTGTGNNRICDGPSVLSISELTKTSVTLNWTEVVTANRYEVEIEDGDNTPPFNWVVKTNATSQNIVGLVAGGEYKFKVKSICGNESSEDSPWFFFSTPTGGNAGNVLIQSSIFPNPTVSKLQISVTDLGFRAIYVEIVNIMGELMWRRKYSGNQECKIEVPVSDFGTGLYQVRIFKDGASKIHRFMVP